MSLIAITGPMFSGKSTELMAHCLKLRYRYGNNFALFKHSSDNRYMSQSLCTHDNISITAIPICNSAELRSAIADKKLKAIAIDEFQFFDFEAVEVIKECINNDLIIYLSMLNSDKDQNIYKNYIGIKPFITNEIIKRAYCDHCKSTKATISYKHTIAYDKKGNEIWIGGKEFYGVLCAKCFKKTKKH